MPKTLVILTEEPRSIKFNVPMSYGRYGPGQWPINGLVSLVRAPTATPASPIRVSSQFPNAMLTPWATSIFGTEPLTD